MKTGNTLNCHLSVKKSTAEGLPSTKKKDKEIDVDELVESTLEITPLEDLNMEISYEGDSNGLLSFSITNNSDIDYLGGDTYHLEYNNNDKWYSVPLRPRTAFNMVGKTIQKGTT
ncbi:MAG: hypothetical protein K5655_09110 [Lachnospiraceae bacterium]|nr:hypothetical protein [Lachnospiraceae bacterium]